MAGHRLLMMEVLDEGRRTMGKGDNRHEQPEFMSTTMEVERI